MQKSTQATFYLIFITLCWGLTFPLIRNAVSDIVPNVFVILRFGIASLLLLPLAIRHFKATSRTILIAGLILGLLNALAYFSQAQGLTTIPASRSAFITGISVILVPLLAPLFKVGQPKPVDYLSAALSLLGLYVLTGANFAHVNIGDAWTLLCALTVALTILTIQKISHWIADYKLLTFYQILFTVPFAATASMTEPLHVQWTSAVIIAIVFCSLVATALTLFLQTKYQRYVSATKTAVIFCLEPIFASIFAYFINHEIIHTTIIWGGALIILGILLPEMVKKLNV